MKRRTAQANAYVAARRATLGDAPANWFDVAEAYDAGLRSAVENRAAARRQFRLLETAQPPSTNSSEQS